VVEAASHSGLPPAWIRQVMRAESADDPRAVSPAGALGLMQLMPATWRELRARLGLGPDPFDVRDNVLAGAAYLREMVDRFGVPGFLAGYNAGPARYADVRAGRAQLPPETVLYVARLAPLMDAVDAPARRHAPGQAGASLFPSATGLFPPSLADSR
jgi:soluble lytic murein transglycosylase-like protein